MRTSELVLRSDRLRLVPTHRRRSLTAAMSSCHPGIAGARVDATAGTITLRLWLGREDMIDDAELRAAVDDVLASFAP
jgi:hypothetical protein